MWANCSRGIDVVARLHASIDFCLLLMAFLLIAHKLLDSSYPPLGGTAKLYCK